MRGTSLLTGFAGIAPDNISERIRYRAKDTFRLNPWCPGPDSNRHGVGTPEDFKSPASTSSATRANNKGS